MKLKLIALTIAASFSQSTMAESLSVLEKTVIQQKQDSRLNTTDVDADIIENLQATDIKGTLNQLSGLTVTNGIRYSQKTFIRGVEEHAANVTIDGARQDGQLFHHSGNQIIDPYLLKKVEVELGAASVLSGYGANVGAVRYVTKDPHDLLNGELFGSSIAVAADSATESRRVNAAFYAQLGENLEGLVALGVNETGDIETPDSDPIVNKHSELKSGLAKLVYTIDEAQQIKLNLQRAEDGGRRAFSGEKPGATTIEEVLGFNGYLRDTFTLSYQNQGRSPLIDLNMNAYYNLKQLERGAASGDYRIWDRQAGQRVKVGIYELPERSYQYRTAGLNVRNTSVINDTAWTYGFESYKSEQEVTAKGLSAYRYDNGNTEYQNAAVANGPTSELLSFYGQAEFKFGDFTLVPGLRYDNNSLGGTYDLSFSGLSPKLKAQWQATDDLRLQMGYGRIFKAPGLPETLFVSEEPQSEEAKLNTEAETGNHVEFNLGYDLTSLLGIDDASGYANVFRYTIDNYYHPTRNNGLASWTDQDQWGYEAGFKFAEQGFSGYLNLSYNQGTNDYGDYRADNLHSGTHRINYGVDYRFSDHLMAGFYGSISSRAKLDDKYTHRRTGQLIEETVEKAGFGTGNVWLSYQPKAIAGLSSRLAIENMFDKKYQNHSSFGAYWGGDYNDYEVGRNIKASVRYLF